MNVFSFRKARTHLHGLYLWIHWKPCLQTPSCSTHPSPVTFGSVTALQQKWQNENPLILADGGKVRTLYLFEFDDSIRQQWIGHIINLSVNQHDLFRRI